MRHFTPIALFALFSASAHAQVIINQSDFPTAGTSFFMGQDAEVPANTNVGTASTSEQNWNFTSLQTDTLFTMGFQNPASVPYGDMFPTADLSFNQSGGNAFAQFANGNVDIIGISLDFGAGSPLAISMGVEASNPWTIFKFPATLGTAYEDTAVFEAKFNSVGLIPFPINILFDPDTIRFKRTTYSDVVIDAYGTLVDALGNTHQVLRMNFHEVSIDTAWGRVNEVWTLAPNIPGTFDNPSVSDTRTMRFISKTMGYIVVGVQMDGTNPASATFLSDPSLCCTGLSELMASETMLVYPNPATDIVRVRTGGDRVEMRIMDLSGREVMARTIGTDHQTVSVSQLPMGTYLYQLVATDGTRATGRLSVTR